MTWEPDEDERPVYDDGYRSGESGRSRNENPHSRGGHAWKVWDWGWVRGLIGWIAKIKSRP